MVRRRKGKDGVRIRRVPPPVTCRVTLTVENHVTQEITVVYCDIETEHTSHGGYNEKAGIHAHWRKGQRVRI